MAGVYAPTAGVVTTRGRISAMIELGAGLDGELTGRENIHLLSAFLARPAAETRRRVEPILEFAGLGEFADVPIKYYSAGMQLRLGFSIATDDQPEILLLDELFAGGDAEFLARARERMRALIRGSAILVLVSHDTGLLREFCDVGIVVSRGAVSPIQPIGQAVDAYLAATTPAPPAPASS